MKQFKIHLYRFLQEMSVVCTARQARVTMSPTRAPAASTVSMEICVNKHVLTRACPATKLAAIV